MQRRKRKISIVGFLFIGYAAIILLGSILLSLPIASQTGESHGYVDCLLTATSATCVTGLIPFPTGQAWTLFGQIVIILMIQVGGMGFMTVITLFYLLFGKRIGLRDQNILMQSQGSYSVGGIIPLIKKLCLLTFGTEGIGALLFFTQFYQDFGWKGLYISVFTSISAFCNAGFDVFESGDSLMSYADNPLVVLTASALVIIGAMGFVVWSDLFKNKFRWKKCFLHTKVVLIANAVLLFGGAILFYIMEFTNIGGAEQFGELSTVNKITNAWFLSASPRTAGFASLDLTKLSGSGQFLTILLMFTGGNSGSTAGGIKVTTVLVVLANLVASARKSNDVKLLNKKISTDTVKQANAILMSYLILMIAAVLAIGAIEKDAGLNEIMFEVVSAVATVGLTLNFTPTLQMGSKLILVFLMYVGRLGAFSLFEWAFSASGKEYVSKPEGKIMVG